MSNYKITYSILAEKRLVQIFEYVALDNPVKAYEFVQEIKNTISNLSQFPLLGKYNTETQKHKLIKYPYLVLYSVDPIKEEIKIHTIRHGARKPLSQ